MSFVLNILHAKWGRGVPVLDSKLCPKLGNSHKPWTTLSPHEIQLQRSFVGSSCRSQGLRCLRMTAGKKMVDWAVGPRSLRLKIFVGFSARQKCQAFFSKRVSQIKITAPTNATMIDPMIPPPGQIPNIPKTHPPRTPPRIPRMMSTTTPYPPPFISLPASQPAMSPTRIQASNPMSPLLRICVSSRTKCTPRVVYAQVLFMQNEHTDLIKCVRV